MTTAITFNTWVGLRNLFLVLLVLYWVLKLVAFSLQKLSNKNRMNKRFLAFIEQLFLLYKPLAMLLILLAFITIDYKIHSIFLVIVGAFGFSQIRNYISGVLLKIHSLIKKGTLVSVGEISGEIKRLLPLGLIVSNESGECFVTYSNLDSNGFTISSKDETVLRQTLYLKSTLSKSQVLDLLFDNPILNFKEVPIVNELSESKELKMQYSLEDGMHMEDLVAFLNEKSIATSITSNHIK